MQGTELEHHEVYAVTYKNGKVAKGIVAFKLEDKLDMRAVISILPDTGEPLLGEVPSASVEWHVLADMYINHGKHMAENDNYAFEFFTFERLRTLDDIKDHFEDPSLFSHLGYR